MVKMGLILTLVGLSLWMSDCKPLNMDTDTVIELLELLQSVGALEAGGGGMEEGSMVQVEDLGEKDMWSSAILEKRDLPRLGISAYRPSPRFTSRKSVVRYHSSPMERMSGLRG